MRKILPFSVALTALAAFAASVTAQAEGRPITEHRSLAPTAKVSVRNLAGVVEVEAWEKNEFDLVGTLGESAEKLEVSGSDSDLQVEVKNRRSSHYDSRDETRLKIRVPVGAALTLDSTSADLVVRGLRGDLNARSVSGDVLAEVPAAAVSLQTVSGDLRVDAPEARELRVATVSGDLHVERGAGALVAESVSGDINVGTGNYTRLDLKSVSGDVDATDATAGDIRIKAEAVSGDVRLRVPASVSADVTLKTFSGDKHMGLTGTQQAGDSRRAQYRIGDGRGSIELTSFSGDVTLDRR